MSGSARAGGTEILALPHPDWLYHHLTVAGDAEQVALFRMAAFGPGIIPWQHGLVSQEEDLFHLLAAPPAPQSRSLSLQGCRILAGQLRDAMEQQQERVRVAAGRAGGCPLDLHRLIPIPAELLRLGPHHPEAQAWLWQHWGTTWSLRHATRLPAGRTGQPTRDTPGQLWLGFWSADWTPWPALLRLRQDWPALRFDLRPRYDDG